MSYYLYIPFSREELSLKLKTSIDQWVNSERKNKKEVILTFRGEQGLDLPKSAKIYVLMHGQPQEASPLIRNTYTASQLTRNFNDPPGHLQLTDGKNSRLVPQIADDMVSDGLFNNINQSRLRIKLFFFDAGKDAKKCAKSFANALSNYNAYRNGEIRIDYYPGNRLNPPTRNNSLIAHKYVSHEIDSHETLVSASSVQQSIFNHSSSRPKLSHDQVVSAVAEYNSYKSSRAYGLSGALKLNGIFSSRESSCAIRALLSDTLSDQARYILAKNFLDSYPNNYFARCLSPQMADAMKTDNLYWKTEVSENSNQVKLSL